MEKVHAEGLPHGWQGPEDLAQAHPWEAGSEVEMPEQSWASQAGMAPQGANGTARPQGLPEAQP